MKNKLKEKDYECFKKNKERLVNVFTMFNEIYGGTAFDVNILNMPTPILSVPNQNSHLQQWHIDFGSDERGFDTFISNIDINLCSLSVLHFPMGGAVNFLQCDVDTAATLIKKNDLANNNPAKIIKRGKYLFII